MCHVTDSQSLWDPNFTCGPLIRLMKGREVWVLLGRFSPAYANGFQTCSSGTTGLDVLDISLFKYIWFKLLHDLHSMPSSSAKAWQSPNHLGNMYEDNI